MHREIFCNLLTLIKVLVLRVRVSVNTFFATTAVSGDVIAFFRSLLMYINTYTNLRILLYVCALRRFYCCKILHANDRYRSNGDKNIYGIT